jgi:tetratricopeptide (TPR) repeat protein/DNA-binding CsgD family transcriptional regulator
VQITISLDHIAKEIEELERTLATAGKPEERAGLLLRLSAKWQHRDVKKGRECAETALGIAERSGDRRLIAGCLDRVAWYLTCMGLIEEGMRYQQAARDLYLKLREPVLAANMLLQIGMGHAKIGKIHRGRRLLNVALRAYERAGDAPGIARVLAEIATCHKKLSEFPDALAALHRAIAVCEELGDGRMLSLCHIETGNCYRDVDDFDRAFHHLFIALDIRITLNQPTLLAVVLNNIGGTCIKHNEPSRAIPYLLHARQIYTSLNDAVRAARSWDGLGGAHELLGEYDEAMKCHRRARRLLGDTPDAQLSLSIDGNIARVRWKQGKHARALRELNDILERTRATGDRHREMEICLVMSLVHEHMGNTAAAFDAYRSSVALKDQVMGGKVIRSIVELEAMQALDRQKHELERTSSRMHALQKDLDGTRTELAAATLQLVQRSVQIRKLSEELDRRGAHDVRTPRNADDLSDYWRGVARRGDGTIEAFHERVIARCPTITSTELKVAGLIRGGLSSKEIAMLLYVTERTVEIHRTNLRRKLALAHGSSLAGFLSGL